MEREGEIRKDLLDEVFERFYFVVGLLLACSEEEQLDGRLFGILSTDVGDGDVAVFETIFERGEDFASSFEGVDEREIERKKCVDYEHRSPSW